MSQLKLTLMIVIAVLGLVIMLQNTESVETSILFMRVVMPRAFLLLSVLALGFLLGMLTILRTIDRRNRRKEEGERRE